MSTVIEPSGAVTSPVISVRVYDVWEEFRNVVCSDFTLSSVGTGGVVDARTGEVIKKVRASATDVDFTNLR